MVSFDVVGLFPSIPVSPTLDRVERNPLDAQVFLLVVVEYMKLFNICLFPNFYEYGDRIYTVSDGVPMARHSPP